MKDNRCPLDLGTIVIKNKLEAFLYVGKEMWLAPSGEIKRLAMMTMLLEYNPIPKHYQVK